MPTLVADISARRRTSAPSVREVLRKVDSFISDNSDSFHSSIKNVEVFTKSLKDNSGEESIALLRRSTALLAWRI